MKLYRNQEYPNRWYAHSPETGWWMFPAEPNGWSKRQPARGLDPIRTRQVPADLAASTGFTTTPVIDEELVEVA